MNTVSNYKKAVLCLKTLQNYFINYSQKIANVGYPNTILPKTNEWITYMFFSCLLNYGMRSETYHKNMIQAYLHHPELFQPNYVVKNFQKKENNLKILLCQNIHPRYPNIATKKWIKLSEELSKFDSLIYKISTLNSFEELYFFIQSFHCFGQKTGGLLIRVIIDSKVCKISDNEMNFIPLDRHDIEISYLNNIIDTNKPTKKKLHELSSTWIKAGKQLNLTPSEVDKYLWEVGNSFCGKKKCATCPLRKNCKKKERI